MKNLLLLILFVAFFSTSNSSSAQTVLGKFPSYNYLDNSENTSDIKLTTTRLRNFQIIIDDSIKLKVLGSTAFNRFTIRNVPQGNHTFVVFQNQTWPNKQPFNHEFTVQSTGIGEQILIELPMPRYNSHKINRQIILAPIAACFFWVLSDWGQ
jgi:hypothetical protein